MASQQQRRHRWGTEANSKDRRRGRQTVLRAANREALLLLADWLSEPDDLGDEWWDAFELELRNRRFSIKESPTESMNSGMMP